MNTAIFDWVKTLFLFALAAGVLPFLYHQIELAQAKLATEKVTKKTKNLAFALSLAKGAVGLAEKSDIISGEDISKGDVIIGVSSSGVHSNGFSLVRKLVKELIEGSEEDNKVD